jgi:predicted nucleic acid-binding protein
MLLDTAGLLALHHHDETHHSIAVSELNAATVRLVHSYVLAEFVALAHVRRLPRKPALDFIGALRANVAIHVVWVDKGLHDDALELLKKRLDKDYSLCDAVSFLLMRRHGINVALTTDKHFEQEGFRRLLV